MIGFGKTDIGKVRPLNEDTLYIRDSAIGCLENLYIVADGMGGHNAGEVASNEAVRFFCEYIENNTCDEILDLMVSALRYANKKVYEMSLENEGYSNMGTTFVGATFKDDMGYFVHVGDSRVYITRGNKIHQITTDHTYV
ncbi:MAG: serine/threonine-protein phosphatase, partial [Firmicutes bacterium]|nr:serine/threonine-protein phosphatase [Bacillota bacterium]